MTKRKIKKPDYIKVANKLALKINNTIDKKMMEIEAEKDEDLKKISLLSLHGSLCSILIYGFDGFDQQVNVLNMFYSDCLHRLCINRDMNNGSLQYE